MAITNRSLGNATYGTVIRFALVQDNVKFIKNIINRQVTASTSTNYAVVQHATSTAMIRRCVMDSNKIYNGSIGVYLYGNTNTIAATFEDNNTLRFNEIINAYYMGVQSYYQRKVEIIGNKIWMNPTYTSSYGLYLIYNDSAKVERNNINNFLVYGIYAQTFNYQFGTGTYRATINNNMLGGKVFRNFGIWNLYGG